MNNMMSEKIDAVSKALMLAKKQIGPVFKDSQNPYFKSKYASLGAFIDATDEALTENGLLLSQCVGQENEKPILYTTLIHVDTGQWLKSTAPLINKSGDSQGLGSAITYMRRYSLCAMLGICADSEDDDGNKSVQPPKKPKPSPETEIQKDNSVSDFIRNGNFDDNLHFDIRTFMFKVSELMQKNIAETCEIYQSKKRDFMRDFNQWREKQAEKSKIAA